MWLSVVMVSLEALFFEGLPGMTLIFGSCWPFKFCVGLKFCSFILIASTVSAIDGSVLSLIGLGESPVLEF